MIREIHINLEDIISLINMSAKRFCMTSNFKEIDLGKDTRPSSIITVVNIKLADRVHQNPNSQCSLFGCSDSEQQLEH